MLGIIHVKTARGMTLLYQKEEFRQDDNLL